MIIFHPFTDFQPKPSTSKDYNQPKQQIRKKVAKMKKITVKMPKQVDATGYETDNESSSSANSTENDSEIEDNGKHSKIRFFHKF